LSADYNSAPAIAADAPVDVLTVPAQYTGMRLDQVLARLMPQHSRSRIRSWIDAGRVTVAGTPEAEKTWGNESWRVGGGGGHSLVARPARIRHDPRVRGCCRVAHLA